jgi:CelD/BcsL family acetyltransferase involved in cellulose biosynthesis
VRQRLFLSAAKLPLKQLSLDDPGWQRFVQRRPDATPFHEPAWAKLLAECYRLPGFALVLTDETGSIIGGIPLLVPPRLPGRDRRLVSLPYTDAVDPLLDDDVAPQFVETARHFLHEFGATRIELRGAIDGARREPVTAVTHELQLAQDPEIVIRSFSKDRRRRIRIAEHSGLLARRAEDERDVTEAFFKLHVETRRRLGVPSQPRRFFRLLWQRIVEPGRGFVLVVEQSRVPVASAVFLTGHGTVVYKYSASTAERRQDNPNDLILWLAIQQACEQGFRKLDFGRSEASATGLRAFKSSWGATEAPLICSTIGDGEQSDVSGVAGLAGAFLRRSPTWLTRALGEAFYRYAA